MLPDQDLLLILWGAGIGLISGLIISLFQFRLNRRELRQVGLLTGKYNRITFFLPSIILIIVVLLSVVCIVILPNMMPGLLSLVRAALASTCAFYLVNALFLQFFRVRYLK